MHVPVPLLIVTVAVALAGDPVKPGDVQTPVRPRLGMTPALVVAVTTKVPRYGAVAGAPVKLTVGVARVAVVLWLAVARRKFASATQVAVRAQTPLPLDIVTVAVALSGVPVGTLTVQTPSVPVMVGMVLALVVVVTTKLVL